jgi:hypothetical protein
MKEPSHIFVVRYAEQYRETQTVMAFEKEADAAFAAELLNQKGEHEGKFFSSAMRLHYHVPDKIRHEPVSP